jgi:hypothetical protein
MEVVADEKVQHKTAVLIATPEVHAAVDAATHLWKRHYAADAVVAPCRILERVSTAPIGGKGGGEIRADTSKTLNFEGAQKKYIQ